MPNNATLRERHNSESWTADKAENTNPHFPKPYSVRGRVLGAHLRGESLTSLDAWRRFGGSRLAADVNVLRKSGWPIETEIVEVETKDAGRRSEVARYFLPSDAIAKAGEEGQRYAEAARQAEIIRRAM